MKKIFYSFLISCFIFTIISCGKSTEENVNDAVSKTNDNIVGGTGGTGGTVGTGGSYGDGDFQINPQGVAKLSEFVTTDNGYALVGSKDRRPWIQILDKNGKHQLTKRYDVFGEYKTSSIFIGNGFPPEGTRNGSAISQTKDGGYIVGTFVLPKHPSYGYSHIFKTNAQGEIVWKRELKYKSGRTKVIHFVEDIMQTNDGHYVAAGYTSGDSGNSVKGQGFVTKIDKDDGTEKWMKRFGSNACVFDTLTSVLEDNENNLIAIGKYEKPCPKYVCHHGYACGDVYFLKINSATGETLISKRHTPNKWWAFGYSILQLDDGSFIVGGKVRADRGSPVNSAVWRLNHNGEMVWSQPWTGTARKNHNEYVFALALNPQRDAVIAAGIAGNDMMAWSMDLNGTQKWVKRYEEPGLQVASGITRIKNNRYLLSGSRWFIEIDSDGSLIKNHNE